MSTGPQVGGAIVMYEADDDRALLEAAARAAGYTCVWHGNDGDFWWHVDPDTARHWNPLTDDGDALRLAVKLGLIVDAGAHKASDGMGAWCAQSGERDGYAATRRAIVRAAAALAKAD